MTHTNCTSQYWQRLNLTTCTSPQLKHIRSTSNKHPSSGDLHTLQLTNITDAHGSDNTCPDVSYHPPSCTPECGQFSNFTDLRSTTNQNNRCSVRRNGRRKWWTSSDALCCIVPEVRILLSVHKQLVSLFGTCHTGVKMADCVMSEFRLSCIEL